MPSAALLRWQTDRLPRLQELEAQYAAIVAGAPHNAQLAEENLRGYVVLLSAHFQGFCRDLYTESCSIITKLASAALQVILQRQFAAKLKLDHNNPTFDNLGEDFDRFGFDFKAALNAVPGSAPPVSHLAMLNKWRNFIAHHGSVAPTGPPLTLPLAQSWQISCGWIGTQIDAIMYNYFVSRLRVHPW